MHYHVHAIVLTYFLATILLTETPCPTPATFAFYLKVPTTGQQANDVSSVYDTVTIFPTVTSDVTHASVVTIMDYPVAEQPTFTVTEHFRLKHIRAWNSRLSTY
jgi:hypothetical protein